MNPYVVVATTLPLTIEIMDDMRDTYRLIGSRLNREFGDVLFKAETGCSRIQPNPYPSLRLFRWLPRR